MGEDLQQRGRIISVKQVAKSYVYSHPTLLNSWRKIRQIQMKFVLMPYSQLKDWLWDSWHGIDSGGLQVLDGYTLKGPNGPEATIYGPSDPKDILDLLSSLGINYSDYIFIDLGAGKGRAVLLASLFPFKKIIGVEFAKELYEVALRNASSWRSKRKCSLIEFVWADILEFEIPNEPCVLYFYHAFSEAVLSQLLTHILRSFEGHRRDIIIVYYNPVYRRTVDSFSSAEPILESLKYGYIVYRIRTDAASP